MIYKKEKAEIQFGNEDTSFRWLILLAFLIGGSVVYTVYIK
jgi:hypothetical protein